MRVFLASGGGGAAKLAGALAVILGESLGHSVDFELFEFRESVKIAENWRRRLREALTACDVVVGCIGRADVSREWLVFELAVASALGKETKLLRVPGAAPVDPLADLWAPEATREKVQELVLDLGGRLPGVNQDWLRRESGDKVQGLEQLDYGPPDGVLEQILAKLEALGQRRMGPAAAQDLPVARAPSAFADVHIQVIDDDDL